MNQNKRNNFRIIGHGGYGCVISPEIKCKTQIPGSREYLSKIQKNRHQTQVEIEIGEIIQKELPNQFHLYFSPIISHCPVNLEKMEKQNISQCRPLTKGNNPLQPPTFISGKIKYIGKKSMGDRLQEIISTKSLKTYIKTIVNSQIYLLRSIQKLSEMGIIHLDIKENNIMYNDAQDIFIIIDFGLAVKTNQLTTMTPTQQLFPHPTESHKYDPWSIDVVLLTYIETKIQTQTQTQTLTQSDIEELKRRCTLFCEQNPVLQIKSAFSEYSRKKLKQELHKWIDTFNGKTWEYAWKQLTANHKSWDNYSLAVAYLFELEDSDIMNKFLPDKDTDKNVMKKYMEMLKKIVLSMPNDRPDPKDTLQTLIAIFNHIDGKEYSKWIHEMEPRIDIKQIQHNKKLRTLSQIEDDTQIQNVR